MQTRIKTVHEEECSNNSRTIGVLLNYSLTDSWTDSLTYVYRNGTYIFFNTFIDLVDYLFYGENKMVRAYLSEADFDNYYDNIITGKFSEKLTWQTE